MRKNSAKAELMSLRSRIMYYTALPVIIVILAAGAFMTGSVRRMIDNISRSEVSGSTTLACNRINELLDDYASIIQSKSERENVRHFLMTAEDRDEMEDNAYFSYAMGELDSTISEYSGMIDRAWIASAVNPGVAFSNTSAGWTAEADFDVKESFFYDDVIAAKDYYITDAYISNISGDIVVSAASIIRDTRTNTVLGIFCADIRLGTLWNKISKLSGTEGCEIAISSSDGNVIYNNDKNMLAKRFDDMKLVLHGSDGIVEDYIRNGSKMIGYSETPKNCRWTIYALKGYEDIAALQSYYTQMTILIFAAVTMIMMLTLVLASKKIADPIMNYTRMINELKLDDDKVHREDADLLVPQECSELENLAVGFNSLIKRNSEMFDKLREMNIKSEKERILYQTALQSSSDVVFEYDIKTDLIMFYGSPLDSSLPKTNIRTYENFLDSIKNKTAFSSPDSHYAVKFLGGEISGELTVSHITDDGSTHWFSLEGTAVLSENIPVKVVGTIRCIDDVVTLREGAQRDLFSGFYNKSTMEEIVRKRLANSNNGAIVLIDIDNFKTVNDVFGHSRGDFVIKDVSAKIESVISAEAIPGRIGGDEFMLFVPRADASSIKNLCELLCQTIRYTYSDEEGNGGVTISASIGCALCPDHGETFEALYGAADIAMYISKNNGKNRYTLYEGQERSEYYGERR